MKFTHQQRSLMRPHDTSPRAMLAILIIVTALLQSTTSDSWKRYFSYVKTSTPADEQAQAVVHLISRLIPKYSGNFEIIVNSTLGHARLAQPALDTFEYVSNNEGKIIIRGTSGVAAALGLQHFLKHFCFAHISWSGDQLNIPEPFPHVKETVRVTSPHR